VSASIITGDLIVYDTTLRERHRTRMNRSLWSHKWSPNSDKFSLGTDLGLWILDTEKNLHSNPFTKYRGGDVFTQTFDSSGKTVIYGTRSGKINVADLSKKDANETKMGYANSMVTHLHLCNNENYLITTSSNGIIKQWDRRMEKAVMSFTGINDCERRLRFSVNEEDNLIFAGGNDKKLYIWSIDSGKLAHTIGPFKESCINKVCYSNMWKTPEDKQTIQISGFWTLADSNIEFWGYQPTK